MRIDIVTIFPEMCAAPLGQSIMKRAQQQGQLDLAVHDLRRWATDKHQRVDDEPFGGGQGMVMKPEPFFACVEQLRGPQTHVVLLSPQGRTFSQSVAAEFSQMPHLLLLCGHYEGVDQRVIDALVHEELSIGDFVLTNGAIAANIIVDAVVRLLPGVLGDERSAVDDSFATGFIEGPVYTRPAEFRGLAVPKILLSGDHGKIAQWRREQSLAKTRMVRPDLLQS